MDPLLVKFDPMAFSLSESIKTLYPVDVVKLAAEITGEKETAVNRVLEVLIPSVFKNIGSRISRNDNISGLHYMAKVAAGSHVTAHMQGLLHGKSNHQGILNMAPVFFGAGNFEEIAKRISAYASVSFASAGVLIRAFVPVALGLLGELIKRRKMGKEEFVSYIKRHQNDIDSLMPLDFHAADLFRMDVNGAASRNTHRISKKKPVVKSIFEKLKFKFSLFLLLTLATLLFYYFR